MDRSKDEWIEAKLDGQKQRRMNKSKDGWIKAKKYRQK